MRKLKVVWFIIFVFFISLLPLQKAYASEWLDIKATPNSQNKVTLSWKKKNVKQYKIYRAKISKNGEVGKMQKIATISGSRKSFVDRKAKKNTQYTYQVEAYKKSGKSLKLAYYGEDGTYTGWLPPTWDDYLYSDYPRSTKLITLAFYAQDSLKNSGYKIYRRQAESGKYKEIAVIKSKKSLYIYKDKSVKKGVTYDYIIKSYHMRGKKKIYSSASKRARMSAVYDRGIFTTSLISEPKANLSSLDFKITSQSGNADLILTADDWFELFSDSRNNPDHDTILFLPRRYSTDGENWNTMSENTKVTLKANRTIYVSFENENGSEIANPADLDGTLSAEKVTYDGLPCFFDIPLKGNKTYAVKNPEYIH